MATKKKTVSFSAALQDKVAAFQKGLESDTKEMVSTVKKQITSIVSELNQVGGAVKIAAYLKSQKIKGITSNSTDCPVQRYIEKALTAKFGEGYFDNEVDVDGENATLDCTIDADPFYGLGDTISVKLGKNIKNFIENFDDSDNGDDPDMTETAKKKKAAFSALHA